MPKIEAYEQHAQEYDAWFEKNRLIYQSELQAVKTLLPASGIGVEIGVGTGRFAQPLGITVGVEPSQSMAEIARKRGITVYSGTAEALPFQDEQYDFAMMVTTICFLDDVGKAFQEAHRVIKPNSSLVVAFIDKNSPLGKIYEKQKQNNIFYKDATFYSVNDVSSFLQQAGFSDFTYVQTVFQNLKDSQELQPVKEGYGEGSFVVIKGNKQK